VLQAVAGAAVEAELRISHLHQTLHQHRVPRKCHSIFCNNAKNYKCRIVPNKQVRKRIINGTTLVHLPEPDV
jgi:hypothetical protein